MCAGSPGQNPMATAAQLCEYWGRAVSLSTIKRAIDAGQIPGITVGATRLVPWSWIQSAASNPPVPSGGTP